MDPILIAKLIAIPTAFLLTGYQSSFSQNTLPLIYNQPASVSTPIFSGVYYSGAAFVLPTNVLSTAAFAYLAYAIPAQRATYGAAGAAVFAILPWTIMIMSPGIDRLIAVSKGTAAEQQKAGENGEVVKLLKAWTAQNWVRVGMTFAGGVAGLYAAVV